MINSIKKLLPKPRIPPPPDPAWVVVKWLNPVTVLMENETIGSTLQNEFKNSLEETVNEIKKDTSIRKTLKWMPKDHELKDTPR